MKGVVNMNFKNIACGGGLLLIGFTAGKIVGYVKSARFTLDAFEEIVPGAKKAIAEKTAQRIIDGIFATKENDESGPK